MITVLKNTIYQKIYNKKLASASFLNINLYNVIKMYYNILLYKKVV